MSTYPAIMTQDLHFANCAKGLICIDLWENDFHHELIKDKDYQSWLEKLSGNLAQFKFDSIINASYHTKIDYNDPSIYNTLVAYNWVDFDQDIMLELIKNSNNYTMSQHIQREVFGKNTFALYSIESFIKHANNMVPHIKDWLVVGASWQICVHHRPLGLVNLSRLKQFNFYATDWGFVKSNNQLVNNKDFETDQLQWSKINDHIYLLNATVFGQAKE
jgi:hypothetical protein